MKKALLFSSLALILAAALPAHAQGGFGGCTNSPENPTLILSGLAAGAFAISSVRARIRARRQTNK